MIKRVYFVTRGYPTDDDPVEAFIKPVVCGIADRDIECTVIAPQIVGGIISRKKKLRPIQWMDHTEKGSSIRIIQPVVFSASNLKLANWNISVWLLCKAYHKVLDELPKPDLIYAHFWDRAISAALWAVNHQVPVVAVSGESEIWANHCFPQSIIEKAKQQINGLICVSQANVDKSRAAGLLTKAMPLIVLPNAIDQRIFYVKDRTILRKQMGYPENAIISVTVGEFSHRKGTMRVVQAAGEITDVHLIFIGSGSLHPEGSQILFSGTVAHDKICDYLNVADFFVLPTLAEGCCNAILEAMACGLPIISSDCSFNDGILDETNSIRVDPNSIPQIRCAIEELKSDAALRQRLSKGALCKAADLTLDKRINKIVNFLEQCVS